MLIGMELLHQEERRRTNNSFHVISIGKNATGLVGSELAGIMNQLCKGMKCNSNEIIAF